MIHDLSARFIPFTDEQHEQMRSLYEQGATVDTLSKKFGICDSTVRRRLRLMGSKLRKRGTRPLISDEQCVELVIEKKDKGTSNRVFANRLSIGIRTADEAVSRGRRILADQAG